MLLKNGDIYHYIAMLLLNVTRYSLLDSNAFLSLLVNYVFEI